MKPPAFIVEHDRYKVTITTVVQHRDVIVADIYLAPGRKRAKIGDVNAGSYGGPDGSGAHVTLWIDDSDLRPGENLHTDYLSIRLAGPWDSLISWQSDREARAVFVRRK